jgi:hypothetical protein
VSLSAPDTPDMVAELLSTSAGVLRATHRHLSTSAVSASEAGSANDTTSSSLWAVT